MSVTIGYYFNTDQPLRDFAETVNGVLGCSLAPYEGDYTDFYCRFLAMEFSLGHNDLESDRDLNFDDFGCFIDARIPSPDNELLTIATQTIMSVAYVLHARLNIHVGMLVRDVQAVLAKYELRDNEFNEQEWYDSVSGKFVRDHTHWLDVLGR